MTVVNLFNAAMLVLGETTQAIAFVAERAGLSESEVLTALAADESSAPALAEYFIQKLGADKKRATLLGKYVKAATVAANALTALRDYDAAAVQPFSVESLFATWTPDLANATPRDYAAETQVDRGSARGQLQGKSVGRGRGNRARYWQKGTYIKDGGQWDGFALELTDDTLTVTRAVGEDLEVVYTASIDWSVEHGDPSVAYHANRAGKIMAQMLGKGENTKYNWPKEWGMPMVDLE